MADKKCKDLVAAAWERRKQAIEEIRTKPEDDETIFDYGLCFDYVEHEDSEGYWRYQISCGGPSDEIRFYGNVKRFYKIEYWYLDWFDGASIDITKDVTAFWVWEQFQDVGEVETEYLRALKD